MMHLKRLQINWKTLLKDFTVTVGLLTAATVINFIMVQAVKETKNVSEIFILCVLTISVKTNGYFWGVLSALAGVVGVNYFFTYPYHRLDFTLTGYPVTFCSMLVVAIIASTLTANVKEQRNASELREKRTSELSRVSGILFQARGEQEILCHIISYFQNVLGMMAEYYPLDGDSASDCPEESGGCLTGEIGSADRQAFEYTVWEKQTAGNGTMIFPDAKSVFCPVMMQAHFFGVLALAPKKPLTKDSGEFIRLLLAQAAIALERNRLSRQQQTILMEKQSERMRGNLLRAISHDLRTPLTGIIGASSALIENGVKINEDARENLLEDIKEDAEWLLRMVENVLSLTKISAGSPAKLKKVLEPAEEVLEQAVTRCKKRYRGIRLSVHVPNEFIMAPMDGTLIEQVLINLIDNAYRHSTSREPIELTVACHDGKVFFEVQDYGKGVPEKELQTLFDGFGIRNRDNCDDTRGLGIGLSICKSIVNAHGGTIRAQNTQGKGLKVTFTLPAEEDSFDER